jgi:hypothetical protein
MILTEHARQQAERRAVSLDDIEYVLDHGSMTHQRSGRCCFFCGKSTKHSTAKNLAVICAEDGAVVTVIRTSSLKKLRSQVNFGDAFHV